jgi:hypothetical protein
VRHALTPPLLSPRTTRQLQKLSVGSDEVVDDGLKLRHASPVQPRCIRLRHAPGNFRVAGGGSFHQSMRVGAGTCSRRECRGKVSRLNRPGSRIGIPET